LASPEPTAEAIWARFIEESSGGVVYIEDKFDGIRAQVHRDSTRVEIFSRDLKRITDQFPEIAEHACVFSADVILDGEIIALDEKTRRQTYSPLRRLTCRLSLSPSTFCFSTDDPS